ncbi:MAG: FecR family protein [Candidatus Cryptobacteroides sp.]
MTKKTIKETIESFSRGMFPEEINSGFEKWMLDGVSAAEKEEAMNEIWAGLDNTPVKEDLTDDPFDLIAEADGLQKHGRNGGRLRKILLSAAGIAAALLAFAGVYRLGAISGSGMCLASADHTKSSFVLPDSSRVWLNSGSRLYLARGLKGRQRKVKLEGEGYFEVRHDERRPFIVKTDKMDITVLGTRFTVTAYEDGPFSACLAEGSVNVSGKGVPETVLKPGEMFSEDGDSWKLTNVRASNFTAWAGNQMVFDEYPLTDIIESLEHWYNVKFTTGGGLKPDEIRLSLTVRTEPVEEILEAIGEISGIHYRIIDEGHILLFID